MIQAPVRIGERIIVHGIMYAVAVVVDIVWMEKEVRWMIVLDWGDAGQSRVYDHDENKTWYRWSEAS